MCMMVASRILRTFCARVVLRNQCYLSAGCNAHRNGRGSVWPVAGKISRHAKQQMAEGFGDKLRDQVYNYPRLYDVSLLPHSDSLLSKQLVKDQYQKSMWTPAKTNVKKSPRPLCVCMAENARNADDAFYPPVIRRLKSKYISALTLELHIDLNSIKNTLVAWILFFDLHCCS